MTSTILILTLLSMIEVSIGDDVPCAGRQTQYGAVCVCNFTYCDTLERPPPLARGQYYRYTTSSDTPGFQRSTGQFQYGPSASSKMNPGIHYQTIFGFGGSFTDSVGIALDSLPTMVQNSFIESYFGASGIEYTLGRVPIGMSDFSTRYYTYNDYENDDLMTNFSLSNEDYKYKNLNHWTSGYIDWNLALDTDGGPYLTQPLDAPVIINATAGEFYKNPMFYVLGHFSKFVSPESKRVDVKSNEQHPTDGKQRNVVKEYLVRVRTNRNKESNDEPSTLRPIAPISPPNTVSCLATINADNRSTVVLLNSMDTAVNVAIVDTVSGSITAALEPNSLNTFVYWI